MLFVVVVVAIGVIWSHVVHGITAGSSSAGSQARLSATLAPVSGGTEVHLTITAASGDLPHTIELTFTPRDSGQAKGGPALTGEPFVYSAIQAGSGARVRAAAGAPGFSIDLPGGGRTLSLSFRVATVAGVRAVRPVPASAALDFTRLEVKVAGGTPVCQRPQQEVGVGYPDFVTCTVSGSGAVTDTDGDDLPADGVRNSVRLVLP